MEVTQAHRGEVCRTDRGRRDQRLCFGYAAGETLISGLPQETSTDDALDAGRRSDGQSFIDRLTSQDLMSMCPRIWGWSQDIGRCHPRRWGLHDSGGRFQDRNVPARRSDEGFTRFLVDQLLYRDHVRAGLATLGGRSPFDVPGTRPGYSLDAHVTRTRLLLACEELRSRRLNRSRPLWEMWFVPGLPGGQVSMFIKVHHSMLTESPGSRHSARSLDTVPLIPSDDRTFVVAEARPVELASYSTTTSITAHTGGRTACSAKSPIHVETVHQAQEVWPAVHEALVEGRAPQTSPEPAWAQALGSPLAM